LIGIIVLLIVFLYVISLKKPKKTKYYYSGSITIIFMVATFLDSLAWFPLIIWLAAFLVEYSEKDS